MLEKVKTILHFFSHSPTIIENASIFNENTWNQMKSIFNENQMKSIVIENGRILGKSTKGASVSFDLDGSFWTPADLQKS